MASGTATATGAQASATGRKFLLSLDFGSGSVDLEQQMPSGSWIKLDVGITSDYSKVYDSPRPATLRFNVISYVSPIEWAIDYE
jgi:hypothetical protein